MHETQKEKYFINSNEIEKIIPKTKMHFCI